VVREAEGGPQSGWPLLVVAGCAFIPVLGIFFGAIAVPWGLVSRRRRARLAAAIGLGGVLLNFAAGLAVALHNQRDPAVAAAIAKAQAADARKDLAKLVAAIDEYHGRTGQYPPSLFTLQTLMNAIHLLNVYDHTAAGVVFPPRFYQYTVASDHASFDVFAVGPDGLPHTADDIRAELPDSILRHSGYRPAR
jgi:Type II secretion system (T2SS), protein G